MLPCPTCGTLYTPGDIDCKVCYDDLPQPGAVDATPAAPESAAEPSLGSLFGSPEPVDQPVDMSEKADAFQNPAASQPVEQFPDTTAAPPPANPNSVSTTQLDVGQSAPPSSPSEPPEPAPKAAETTPPPPTNHPVEPPVAAQPPESPPASQTAAPGVTCTNCSHVNEIGARRCAACQTELKKACVNCGVQHNAAQRRCVRCHYFFDGRDGPPNGSSPFRASAASPPSNPAPTVAAQNPAPPKTAAPAEFQSPPPSFQPASNTPPPPSPTPATNSPQAPPTPAPSQSQPFHLVVLGEKGEEKVRFALKEGANEVGAESPGEGIFPAIDLSPLDEHIAVSRRHACLIVQQGKIELRNHSPMNHTYVDGAKMPDNTSVALQRGSLVRFAKFVARIE